MKLQYYTPEVCTQTEIQEESVLAYSGNSADMDYENNGTIIWNY